MKNLFVFLTFFATSLLFASGKADWIDSAESLYPSSQYITGIASGPTKETAQSAAKLALCQQLGESIKGEQSTSITSTKKSDTGEMTVNVNENILFDKITGIQIKETTTQNNITYALAVLSRKEAGDYYYTQATEQSTQIMQLLSKANTETNSLKKCGYATQAKNLAQDNEYNLNLLKIINPTKFKMVNLSYKNTTNVQHYCDEISSAISFYLTTTGEHATPCTNGIIKALEYFGFTQANNANNATYLLNTEISTSQSQDDKYYFERYSVTSSIIDNKSQTPTTTLSTSGREGQTSIEKSIQRVDVKIADKIKEDYIKQLEDYLQ